MRIILFLLIPVISFSQGPGTDSIVARECRFLKSQLTLTHQQFLQIESATRLHFQDMDSIRKHIADTASRRELLTKSKKKYNEAIKQVVSVEQFNTYRQLVLRREKHFSEKLKGKKISVRTVNNDL